MTDRGDCTEIGTTYKSTFGCPLCKWVGSTLSDSKEVDQESGGRKHSKESPNCSRKNVELMRAPFKTTEGNLKDCFKENLRDLI
ncbi:hypothetical protein KKC45_00480 [Patescibacteria group bacterium]|nr:hypothetical protein [Patescibacteria group bacterium]